MKKEQHIHTNFISSLSEILKLNANQKPELMEQIKDKVDWIMNELKAVQIIKSEQDKQI